MPFGALMGTTSATYSYEEYFKLIDIIGFLLCLHWDSLTCLLYQRWIQDFPEEGRQPHRWGANLLFGPISPKTAWKWKSFDPKGGHIPGVPLDPLKFVAFMSWTPIHFWVQHLPKAWRLTWRPSPLPKQRPFLFLKCVNKNGLLSGCRRCRSRLRAIHAEGTATYRAPCVTAARSRYAATTSPRSSRRCAASFVMKTDS